MSAWTPPPAVEAACPEALDQGVFSDAIIINILASGIKCQHEPPCILSALLQLETAEKQARSIKYRITVGKLRLAKDDVDFTGSSVSEKLMRQLATGAFLAERHAIVLVGRTATGKSHLSIGLARALIRS